MTRHATPPRERSKHQHLQRFPLGRGVRRRFGLSADVPAWSTSWSASFTRARHSRLAGQAAAAAGGQRRAACRSSGKRRQQRGLERFGDLGGRVGPVADHEQPQPRPHAAFLRRAGRRSCWQPAARPAEPPRPSARTASANDVGRFQQRPRAVACRTAGRSRRSHRPAHRRVCDSSASSARPAAATTVDRRRLRRVIHPAPAAAAGQPRQAQVARPTTHPRHRPVLRRSSNSGVHQSAHRPAGSATPGCHAPAGSHSASSTGPGQAQARPSAVVVTPGACFSRRQRDQHQRTSPGQQHQHQLPGSRLRGDLRCRIRRQHQIHHRRPIRLPARRSASTVTGTTGEPADDSDPDPVVDVSAGGVRSVPPDHHATAAGPASWPGLNATPSSACPSPGTLAPPSTPDSTAANSATRSTRVRCPTTDDSSAAGTVGD